VTPITTERLTLRRLTLEDAGFMLELLNSPGWLQFIGDRGVRTLDDARQYLEAGALVMYARYGFGLYRVGLKDSDEAIGICGLVKRDALEDVDIGFALLPQFHRHGYALEAGRATLSHARDDIKLQRVVGITTPHNHGSIRVLETLGLRFEKMVRLSADDVELKLFALNF
jgi:[ribosomal protein S5]-alanine N-acetyltransferase